MTRDELKLEFTKRTWNRGDGKVLPDIGTVLVITVHGVRSYMWCCPDTGRWEEHLNVDRMIDMILGWLSSQR